MEENALQTVYQSLLGDNSLLVKIRRGDGLNETDWEKFKQAVGILIEIYKEKEFIPKKLALAFVDVSNYFYVRQAEYSAAEEDRLEDAAQEIVQMADELFS